MKMALNSFFISLLLIGCTAGLPNVAYPPASEEASEVLPISTTESGGEILPEDTVPQIMSSPSGDETLVGIDGGQAAPFSGVLLNPSGAAWLESEPDATQERCQLFINRRLGEVRAVFGARISTLELTLQTQERVQAIELQNRDLQITTLNNQIQASSGNWWEQVLWIGGSLIIGTALGIIFSLFAN